MPDHHFTRRTLLKLGGAALCATIGPAGWPEASTEVSFTPEAAHAAGLQRFPRMVQEYYVARLRQIAASAKARRMGLKTEAEARVYVREVQDKIQQCFGPWPEKTPLNPRTTGSFDRESYRVENVIFESRPGFLVSANLYLPKITAAPLPGVVGACGHTKNGKAGYQEFAQGLVKQGYAVLLFDPIGQGERLQYLDASGQSRVGAGVSEHLLAGNQQFLVGESFASWRAWDGIRALDYLLTRPEVDPHRVGITGNSGGGTMTTWLLGVEPRWTMGAPSCFVTTFLHNLENEEPQDTEQCPPHALALGLDHADFLAANAPDPIIILAKEKDFFDVRGAEETYAQLEHLYGLLGAESSIGFFAGEGHHGYTQDNREAMYRWFNQATGMPSLASEPEIVLEEDVTLHCAPNGQVAALGSKTVFQFTREKSQQLAKQRTKHLDSNALKSTFCQVLRLPALSETPPDFRVLKDLSAKKYFKPYSARYAVETEPGIQALVYRLSDEALPARPPKLAAEAVLYVAHLSSDFELQYEPLLKDTAGAAPESILYACDVRGIGESRPDVAGNDAFLKPYGSDYLHAIHGIMLDEPCIGRRTLDVLRVLQWLQAHGHESVHLMGRGWGAIPAAFAAVLSDFVTRVTLKAAPSSYAAIAETEEYHWPLATLLPGVLGHFDLPDCYRALEGRQLQLIEPGTA